MKLQTWPGHKPAALSLIVPDGDLDPRIWLSALQTHDLHATFFVSPTDVLRDVAGWQELISAGNEIGNGCLNGVTDDGMLPNWTLRMIQQEVHMAQTFFEDMFSTYEADCFMAPGHNLSCAEGDYSGVLTEVYRYLLTLWDGANATDQSLSSLRTCAPSAAMNSSLGDGWSIARLSSLDDLEEVGQWVFDHPTDRWCATVTKVGRIAV